MTALVFAAVIAASVALALWSRLGHTATNLREFVTASHQFGSILVFFLSVGETYSVGGLLGFPGGVYAKGLPFAVWFVAYILLAAPLGYFLNPLIWRAARRTDAVTLPDLYEGHFRHRGLEITVAVTAIAFLVPWGAMQFAGLAAALRGLDVTVAPPLLMAAAAALAFFYLALSGIRAPAYVSVLKDVLMILTIALVATAALHTSGLPHGPWPTAPVSGPLLNAEQERYAVTTSIFQTLGLYMSPLCMAYIFTARSALTIRRAQIPMPLYMVMFPALAVSALWMRAQHTPLASPNDAFLASARALLPPGLVGLVAGGAALAGLVVLAGICLVIGPIISRNLLPHVGETHQKRAAQTANVAYLLLSIAAALALPGFIVTMNNLTYLGITQYLPGILVIVTNRRVSPVAVAAGILTGDAVAVTLFLGHIPLGGINAGLIGLLLNTAIVLAARPRPAQE